MMCSSSSVLRYWSWMTVRRSSAEVARSWAFLRASASSRRPGDASSSGRWAVTWWVIPGATRSLVAGEKLALADADEPSRMTR